ncbi:MAG TPA: DNA alkylation repair protein [Candidatus Nanoarchaeia archaeon]|nr:DNA alkylation repair protein [Candidatus Nanoarchaeia archaeon]
MNKHHEGLLKIIKKNSGKPDKDFDIQKYHGSRELMYWISIPTLRKIAKEWKSKNNGISLKEFVSVLDSLNKGESYTEKAFAGMLQKSMKKHKLDPLLYDKWLENVHGWACIDSLCQSSFSAEDLLSEWNKWKKLLVDFSKSKNISKRRASLVFLTTPVSQSADKRLSDLAFENIDRLKHEKDILITKAISWILRSLVKHHKKEVSKYLEDSKESLPKIAIRETKNKITYGIKSYKKK